jgi:hypothetical protein
MMPAGGFNYAGTTGFTKGFRPDAAQAASFMSAMSGGQMPANMGPMAGGKGMFFGDFGSAEGGMSFGPQGMQGFSPDAASAFMSSMSGGYMPEGMSFGPQGMQGFSPDAAAAFMMSGMGPMQGGDFSGFSPDAAAFMSSMSGGHMPEGMSFDFSQGPPAWMSGDFSSGQEGDEETETEGNSLVPVRDTPAASRQT